MRHQLKQLWPAVEPPSGFAERVVERALAETHSATPVAPVQPVRRQASPTRAWKVSLFAALATAALVTAILIIAGSWQRRDRGELSAEVPQQISIGGRAQALLSAGAHLKWSTTKSSGPATNGTRVEQDKGTVEYRVQPGGPFIVETPFGRVEVAGTTFEVRVGATPPEEQNMKLKKSSMAAGGVLGALLFVSVYEGKVLLAHGDRQIMLARGEAGRIDAEGIPERVAPQAAAADSTKTSAEVARSTPALMRGPSHEQQQLRERVLATLREHQMRETSAGAAPAASGATDNRDGTMADKTGHLGPEVKIMNHELIPMVRQCFDEARQRKPHLHGMLAVDIKLAGAEGVGSIIESLEPDAKTEISDPELIDCIRQSAFSIQLPPPRADRNDRGMLTIPFGSDAGTH
jgi:hypothetical protein